MTSDERLFWTDADGTAHERCQLFFASTQETVEFDPGACPELLWPRGGWAFYCTFCVDIWERVVMFDSRKQQRPSECVRVSCVKHYDQWNIPGSVLAEHLDGLLNYLPPAILKREFEVHLQYIKGEV